jgi:hypothetical protein
VREAAKWLQTALDGGQPSANLHGAPHRLMRAKRTRRWHISEITSPGVCNGDVKHALPLANARRAHAIAHVLPLPCGEVLRIADHEKMASKQALGKWRRVVKGGVSPHSCTAALLAFLQPRIVNAPSPDDALPQSSEIRINSESRQEPRSTTES